MYDRHAVGDLFCLIHKTAQISTRLTIGRASYINLNAIIGGEFPVKIGSFCSIAANFYCWTLESHDISHITSYPLREHLGFETTYPSCVLKPQGVSIGNDVYIGEGVRLMPGVSIADGAVIAARSVVSRDVGPYEVHGGVANRLLKKRFSEPIIEALLNIAWWNWPAQKLAKNTSFFNLDLTTTKNPKIIFDTIVD